MGGPALRGPAGPGRVREAGREKARRLGGAGTAAVCEFAAAELGAQAAPEVARAKEERAAKARFAKKLAGEAHGMASFLIRADVATIDAIDAAVTQRAKDLEESQPDAPGVPHLATDDDRRVHAVLLALTGATPDTPAADLLPRVQLFVHCYAGTGAPGDASEGIARVEGHGPVTEEWVRRVLGPHAKFRVQPVLDLAGQAPVDAYEIPERHRQAVHLMTPADTFPFASCTARGMQVDHTVPYEEGGVTGVGNYGPMTTGHHRIKTHGRWQVRQPFPGIYVWRDPHGAYYLIDHTGTRRIPTTPPGPAPPPPPPRRTLVVELWRTPYDLRIDLDPAA